ncbi:MAG TPA: VTT domain-containing protein [Candidatus Limnocylindrales bacterium]|nr:VTT domain-containing protein [Candidatus Limnocylindrales bacterium]
MFGIDLEQLIRSIGYIGIWAIVFAESGLLIGFFLPGDSLLFLAGFLASQGFFSLPVLALGCFIAAVAGDSVGYSIGKRYGKRLFQREDSVLFHKKNIVRAQEFYEKYGAKTIVLARFVPVVRTFAPVVAGIGDMHYRTFLSYNIVGGFLWAVGVTAAGYFLGNLIPADVIDKVLLPVIALIIVVSVAPAAYEVLKTPEGRAEMKGLVRMALAKVGIGRPAPVAPPAPASVETPPAPKSE